MALVTTPGCIPCAAGSATRLARLADTFSWPAVAAAVACAAAAAAAFAAFAAAAAAFAAAADAAGDRSQRVQPKLVGGKLMQAVATTCCVCGARPQQGAMQAAMPVGCGACGQTATCLPWPAKSARSQPQRAAS
jgi:hypothetical protein